MYDDYQDKPKVHSKCVLAVIVPSFSVQNDVQCLQKVFMALHFLPHFVMLQPYSKMDFFPLKILHIIPCNDNLKRVCLRFLQIY
ncbi:hypothetical protein PAMP_022399 [Pampus punctatissimus]